ncbi:unnamed protein product [Amoebophrya sp. A120]|nr:unnamed protein product [Amoebophrya sp. A120]|eukprot:GSA120T00024580001.1
MQAFRRTTASTSTATPVMIPAIGSPPCGAAACRPVRRELFGTEKNLRCGLPIMLPSLSCPLGEPCGPLRT